MTSAGARTRTALAVTLSRRVTVQRIASDRGAARRGAGQRRRHALPIRYCPRRTVAAIAKDNLEILLRISHPDRYPDSCLMSLYSV